MIVMGDKIVTAGAIVQLVFTTRLATENDYKTTSIKPISPGESSSDDSDIEEDDVDILIGRKKSHNDGEPVPIPLTHAPYFPLVLTYPPSNLTDPRNTSLAGGLSSQTAEQIESLSIQR
jgi:hypothetical protein